MCVHSWIGFLVIGPSTTSGSGATHTVQLYDEKTPTTAVVATDAGTVVARAGALWWSTGAKWHVLYLTSLR